MILHMGVRTTDPVKVAYKPLEPDEDETSAIAELLGKLTVYQFFDPRIYDHSMVVYYDPPGSPGPRRELLIPVPGDVEGVETRIFPSMRSAFIVFKGTETTIEEYYELLQASIEEAGLVPRDDIYSIEIMYVPDDLDNADYTLEIMIPLEG
jgi:effector-binding domain-containing protein